MKLRGAFHSVRGQPRRATRAMVGAMMALVATSCGTRVEPGATENAVTREPAESVPTPGAAGTSTDDLVLASRESSPGSSPAASEPERKQPAAKGPGTPGTTRSTLPAAGHGGTTASPTASPRKGGSEPVPAPTPGGGTGGGPAGTLPEKTSARSPVIVASIGSYSGFAGEPLAPMLHGAQLWVKDVNQRGGLNGHPVTLVVYDDGGDPARHRAQVQEAVETRHAIAFLMNAEVLTGQSSVEYLNQKRVPVIGMTGGEAWAYSSPMYFPQHSAGDALADIMLPPIAQAMVPKGKTKIGTIICVEAQQCDLFDRTIARDAKPFGMEHAYRGRASVTQPDYTAECLAARNAGVQVLLVILTYSGTSRVSAACARQGYRPAFATIGSAHDDRLKDDPNLDGLVGGMANFPYWWSGTPATDAFQRAFRAYGKGLRPGMGPALGWTAGALLEKAGTALGEPPTSEALLAGLWSIKEDTLGGITSPLTFVKNQPPSPKACWFNFELRQRTWVSPDKFTLHCK